MYTSGLLVHVSWIVSVSRCLRLTACALLPVPRCLRLAACLCGSLPVSLPVPRCLCLTTCGNQLLRCLPCSTSTGKHEINGLVEDKSLAMAAVRKEVCKHVI